MRKLLITGAGGFIGGRLVEVLKETLNPEISILLRNIEKAARISRYPLHYYTGNAEDERAVELAIEGCDIVVHCAHDFAHPESNLVAADCIAKQCLKHNIKRLVYISSFSVHESKQDKNIQEQSPWNQEWDYAINKQEVEKKLVDYYQRFGLPVIILRPTIVYGPFSTAWTTVTVLQMLENRIVVPYEGQRICNAVYIDDVVQAILQAIQSPQSCNGKSFIVSGPDAVSWKEYYNAYLAYAGLQEPVYLSNEDSDQLDQRLKMKSKIKRRSLFSDPIPALKKTPIYGIYQRLLKSRFLRKRLLNAKTSIPRPLLYPSVDLFDTLSCTGKADISKLKNELGFQPKIRFADGMAKTIKWINWANLNSN